MEKETAGNALVLALTYNGYTPESDRSSRFFDWRDVQDLLKRIREQIFRDYKVRASVSFIAAGERGDRFSRCHWHLLIFSEQDLTTVGTWTGPGGMVCRDSSEIISPLSGPARRREWSLWAKNGKSLGFVTVQDPDYGGMRYALAYALKNQFNFRNSENAGRAAKSEAFAEGYLVMSKKPPIGARWIDAYVEKCRAGGIVPPTLRVRVDGLREAYWPTRMLAVRLAKGLASVNVDVLALTGKPALGWSSLVAECADQPQLLEALGVSDGKAEEKDPDESATFGLRTEEKAKWQRWRDARDRYIVASAAIPAAPEGGDLADYWRSVDRAEAYIRAAAERLGKRTTQR